MEHYNKNGKHILTADDYFSISGYALSVGCGGAWFGHFFGIAGVITGAFLAMFIVGWSEYHRLLTKGNKRP